MTEAARELAQVRNPVLLLSAGAWVVILSNSGSGGLAHCAVTSSGASSASFQMLLAMNPPASLLTGWFLMLVAMMAPTLIEPIRHILERSFRKRRVKSITLFATGYTAIWMLAGAALLAAQLVLSLLAQQSYAPAILVGIVAFVWQCSPFKQRCLNRGHNHSELRAFGIGADLDTLRFGIMHGVWCVGSCWALMLFPMLLPHGHNAAMAAMTILMISERLDRPRPLSWRLRGPGKLIRAIIGQIKIRLKHSISGPATVSSSV